MCVQAVGIEETLFAATLVPRARHTERLTELLDRDLAMDIFTQCVELP